MRIVVLLAILMASCARTGSSPPPERPALRSLLAEKKFQPTAYYTGPDTPEDAKPLHSAVDSAISDVAALPDPLDKDQVRDRLSTLIRRTDLFATEDRDQVYRYAVRTWRAAGFTDESGLFGVPDEKLLAGP